MASVDHLPPLFWGRCKAEDFSRLQPSKAVQLKMAAKDREKEGDRECVGERDRDRHRKMKFLLNFHYFPIMPSNFESTN